MRSSEPGKSVHLEIGIWFDEKQNRIHIAAKGVQGSHTTIAPNAESKRGHPNLSRKLAKCLRDEGAPHPHDREGTRQAGLPNPPTATQPARARTTSWPRRRSISATSSRAMPGSDSAWPAPGTILSAQAGQAAARRWAAAGGQIMS